MAGGKRARWNPSNSPAIILWIPYHILAESIPRTGTSKKIDLKASTKGSSLKTTSLEIKKNLMGTFETNVTEYLHPQAQQSPSTQPSSAHTRLMEHQTEIQLETWKIMVTASKALSQYVSANTKGGRKKIPSMYKKDALCDKLSYSRNINIRYKYQHWIPQSLGSRTETPRTILRIFIDRQWKTNITRRMVMSSKFVPGGAYSLVIQTWNPMINYQAHN